MKDIVYEMLDCIKGCPKTLTEIMYERQVNYMSIWTQSIRLEKLGFINREKKNRKVFCTITRSGHKVLEVLDEFNKKR